MAVVKILITLSDGEGDEEMANLRTEFHPPLSPETPLTPAQDMGLQLVELLAGLGEQVNWHGVDGQPVDPPKRIE